MTSNKISRIAIARKAVAGFALAATLLTGTAALAGAVEPDATKAKPSTEQVCAKAEQVWDRLVQLDGKAREAYAKLEAARDKAAAAGKTELASRLTKRLETLRTKHAKLVERAQKLHDKAADRCHLNGNVAPLS